LCSVISDCDILERYVLTQISNVPRQ